MATFCFDFDKDTRPFFSEGTGITKHHAQCSVGGLKNTNKKLSNIILQGYGDSGCELEFKSSILQALYLEKSKVE